MYFDVTLMSQPPPYAGAPTVNPDNRPLPEGWITQFNKEYALNRDPQLNTNLIVAIMPGRPRASVMGPIK